MEASRVLVSSRVRRLGTLFPIQLQGKTQLRRHCICTCGYILAMSTRTQLRIAWFSIAHSTLRLQVPSIGDEATNSGLRALGELLHCVAGLRRFKCSLG